MSTAIHKLRIRTAERDAHAVEQRVAALLNAADLRPRALPPSSILVVRRIGPGLPPLRVDGHSVRPPADWQEAVLDALDRLARLAQRPAGGPVAERAESVLFLDRAELLACLAADWVDGTLASRWWWPNLFPRADLHAAAVRSWLESPEYAPAAIERLAWTGHAAAFVRKLPGRALPVMARDVARAFGLRDLERAIEIVFARAAIPENAIEGEPPSRQAGLPIAVAPPWAPWVPEARNAALTTGQRAFLGIALAFQRAPQAVRDRAFAMQMKIWAQGSAAIEAGGLPKPGGDLPDPVPMAGERAPSVAAASPPEEAPIPAGESAPLAGEAPPVPQPVVEMATAAEFCVERTPFDWVEIETSLGGLFYLINLGIYLGYYGDFSTPEEPGIDLPIWDFVTLVGRRLLEEPCAEDPVWGILARLVGQALPPANPEFLEPHWDGLEEAMQRVTAWLAAGKLEGLVVMHSARVRLTGTHLDIFLTLEELPVEIRIARLDRDPGWVPAAGRYIAFHFQ
jgi:hypothetical protein